MTITEFLEARIAEDELVAKAATQGPWIVDDVTYAEYIHVRGGGYVVRGGELSPFDATEDALHIIRHDPARVLAECAAKRAILELHGPVRDEGWKSGAANDYLWCGSCGSIDDSPEPYPCPTIRAIAAIYIEDDE